MHLILLSTFSVGMDNFERGSI